MPETSRTLTPKEEVALEAILRRYRGRGLSVLLPCLHDVQAITRWLDADTCAAVANSLGIPAVQVHDVVQFYALYYDKPVGAHIVRVCNDLACYLAGSENVVQACSEQARVSLDGGTSADGSVTLEIHPCLGRCEQAPFLMIDDTSHGSVQVGDIQHLLEELP